MPDDEKEVELPPFLAKLIEKVNPADIFILTGGFWLGYNAGLEPGFRMPLIGYLGLPTARDPVREAELEVLIKENDRLLDEGRKSLETTRAQMFAFGPRTLTPDEQRAIQERQAEILRISAWSGKLRSELNARKVAQGILMALFAYAFTRPGILSAVIGAVGEAVPF